MLNLMPVHYFWWLEGLPPCQGTALLHSLGGTRAQGATCTHVPCAPRPGLHLQA